MAETQSRKETPQSTPRPRPSQAEGERETTGGDSETVAGANQQGKDPGPHEKPSQAEGERDRA